DGGLWGVDDGVIDDDAASHGKTMHEDAVVGSGHLFFGHAPFVSERHFEPRFFFRGAVVLDTSPAFRIHDFGAVDSIFHGVDDAHTAALLGGEGLRGLHDL